MNGIKRRGTSACSVPPMPPPNYFGWSTSCASYTETPATLHPPDSASPYKTTNTIHSPSSQTQWLAHWPMALTCTVCHTPPFHRPHTHTPILPHNALTPQPVVPMLDQLSLPAVAFSRAHSGHETGGRPSFPLHHQQTKCMHIPYERAARSVGVGLTLLTAPRFGRQKQIPKSPRPRPQTPDKTGQDPNS